MKKKKKKYINPVISIQETRISSLYVFCQSFSHLTFRDARALVVAQATGPKSTADKAQQS